MPRGADTISYTKHGVDAGLKGACEAVIAHYAWRPPAPRRSGGVPARPARLQLYLADKHTASVLLLHVRARVEDDPAVFCDAVWSAGDGEGVLSSERCCSR